MLVSGGEERIGCYSTSEGPVHLLHLSTAAESACLLCFLDVAWF